MAVGREARAHATWTCITLDDAPTATRRHTRIYAHLYIPGGTRRPRGARTRHMDMHHARRRSHGHAETHTPPLGTAPRHEHASRSPMSVADAGKCATSERAVPCRAFPFRHWDALDGDQHRDLGVALPQNAVRLDTGAHAHGSTTRHAISHIPTQTQNADACSTRPEVSYEPPCSYEGHQQMSNCRLMPNNADVQIADEVSRKRCSWHENIRGECAAQPD